MHVLAVSGLHVGIIYGFFFLFWKPQKMTVRKRIPLLLLVIGIIWSYALITGMSPSVLRAATMFSLIALAQMQSKSPSIFNPLALSALILLLYDPFIVFSVGFQLSYVALLGILLFQPLIVSWWTPENRLLDYIWQISSVGIAAQLATFPLSVHYFHVFPTYFLLANIVAIPGAFAIMAFGIPFLLLSPFEPVAEILGLGLSQLINTVNTLIFSVQFLPLSRLENLRFSGIEMLLVWAGICCLFLLIVQRKKRFAYLAVLPALALVVIRWWDFYETMKIDELVIYKFDKGKAVDYFYKGQLYSLDDGISDADLGYKVTPYRVQKGMTTPKRLVWKYVEEDPLVFLPDGQLIRLPMSPQSPKHHMNYFHGGEWKQPAPPYDAIPTHYALQYLAK
jgi:competence protein ComEC